jgi:hypothetical protein
MLDLIKLIYEKTKHILVLVPCIALVIYTHHTYEYIITRTAPIELLANAIATQEGYFAGKDTLPRKNNNPGNLTASILTRPKDKRGFVIFKSRQEGSAALYNQLTIYAVRGYTIRQMIEKYAPKSDGNNTDQYVQQIVDWTGMDPDRKMMDYLRVEDLAQQLPQHDEVPEDKR